MATRGFEHVTQADVNRRALKQALSAKPAKYHNVKVVVDGHKFDSKREADYWCQLRVREKAGEIQWLRRQVRIPLYAPDLTQSTTPQHVQICEFVADYDYYDRLDCKRHVVDAKGKKTAIYLLKKKWLALQENLIIEEV